MNTEFSWNFLTKTLSANYLSWRTTVQLMIWLYVHLLQFVLSKLFLLTPFKVLMWARKFCPHSSTLAWKIPWMEEPSRLKSMGSQRVGHDWVTWLSLFTFMHWRRKWQPTPAFLTGESQGWGSLVGCIYRVTQSWTWLKWLSSSSSSSSRKFCSTKDILREE